MALPSLLSNEDLLKFRTRFCERFLQYGECNFGGKCQYSHNMTWRRRSPQKYLYEPRMCENVISFCGENGKRQTTMNCHNGKSCKFAHSREEVLYHPLLYKTIMCEEFPSCNRYYCPFGHCVEELLPTNESVEYIRQCYRDVESVEDDDSSDQLDGGNEMVPLEDVYVEGGGLRMRKASGGIVTANTSQYRVCLPTDWNNLDPSAWISVVPSLRIETIARAHSPVTNSELCRAMVTRNEFAGAAAKKNLLPTQMCLAKVVQSTDKQGLESMAKDLGQLAKTEHRNIVSIKRVHLDKSTLILAFEQCPTSLYQAIVDGYSGGLSVRGLARKLNAHNGQTSSTAIQRIGEILAGVQRLHFIGIAHLRICPTNILVDSESCFKVADFLGKLFWKKKENLAEPVAVWQAPETLTKNKLAEKKCDIYSIGQVVFYALTGQHLCGTFASTDRLAAGGILVPNKKYFTDDSVMDNMANDYFANQHLLYNCPLVLDFVFRCCALDPVDRPDIADLARHPLFWDLDFVKSFVSSLPFEDPVFAEFASYEVFLDEKATTVGEACKFLMAAKENPDEQWLKILDRQPQILIRAWDGQRIAKQNKKSLDPIFRRNHLHWMALRASATTSTSHQFVREYYASLAATLKDAEIPEPSFPDESPVLSEAALAASKAKKFQEQPPVASRGFRSFSEGPEICFPRPSPPMTPIVTASLGTPGMTFVDPLIVKQMAAASAALSAVYDNPDLVRAIAGENSQQHPQLVAAATIYASLLENQEPSDKDDSIW